MTAERIAELAGLGVELPARAVVVSSAADSDGYRATVDVLTPTGKQTGQLLEDLPLDRLWLSAAGAGVFAPPMPDQQVLVDWVHGSATGPVIVSAAPGEPAAPFAAVPMGGWALQDGTGGELRRKPDGSWSWRDAAGAEIAVDVAHLWRIASVAESLFPVLDEWLDALISAMTIPAIVGSPLPFNAGTIAALTAIKARLAQVLRE